MDIPPPSHTLSWLAWFHWIHGCLSHQDYVVWSYRHKTIANINIVHTTPKKKSFFHFPWNSLKPHLWSLPLNLKTSGLNDWLRKWSADYLINCFENNLTTRFIWWLYMIFIRTWRCHRVILHSWRASPCWLNRKKNHKVVAISYFQIITCEILDINIEQHFTCEHFMCDKIICGLLADVFTF